MSCSCLSYVQNAVAAEDINVDQIMAGLSNQLFKVTIRDDYPDRSGFVYTDVLFRIYGKDVNSLYDSSTELCVFKQLGLRGVAPHLIAEVEVSVDLVSFFHFFEHVVFFIKHQCCRNLLCASGWSHRRVD